MYLAGSSRQFGLKRTLLFIPAGYFIAWLSEYSSIHNGFPYGLYSYTGLTMGRELWFLGVPFFDSLSYVFLAYASYSSARFLLASKTGLPPAGFKPFIVASFMFMCLDIVIDPAALRGDRWFLGKIYYYPAGGAYFGVPVSNFLGWLLVGFILVTVFGSLKGRQNNAGFGPLAGPLLYLSVLVFNLGVTFYIGEYALGFAGCVLFLAPSFLLFALKLKDMKGLPLLNPLQDRSHGNG